jgi:hypothetical protein
MAERGWLLKRSHPVLKNRWPPSENCALVPLACGLGLARRLVRQGSID